MLDYNISVRDKNEIFVEGIINFSNANTIMKLGCQYINKLLVVNINFQYLKHSDSSGLAVILAWARYAEQQKKVIKIYNMPKFLSDLSKVSNIDQILPIAINK